MPRAPRCFVDGATYHVYGRVSRGEHVFADPGEASRFAAVIANVKRRDGLTLLAWCIMANHYHLLIRTATVPLWRSIRLIQWRYAIGLNRRRRQLGPLWQGRYHARLVEDERYLLQALAYIHLNPVAAGIVSDPAAYRWSGHGELLRRTAASLVDADVTLALFGTQRGAARRAYVGMLRGERAAEWLGETPGHLPWWRRRDADEIIGDAWDEQRSAANQHPERQLVRDAASYVNAAALALGTTLSDLGGRGKMPAVVRAREVLTVVGVERFGMRMKDLAERLGMSPASVSRWSWRAAARRTADPAFARRCLEFEHAVAAALARKK